MLKSTPIATHHRRRRGNRVVAAPVVDASILKRDDDDLLFIDEVSRYLRVHRDTVRREITAGNLGAIIAGKSGARIPVGELKAYIAARRVRPGA